MKSCPPGLSVRLNVGGFYKQTSQRMMRRASRGRFQSFTEHRCRRARRQLPPAFCRSAQVFLVVVCSGRGRTASSSRSFRPVQSNAAKHGVHDAL